MSLPSWWQDQPDLLQRELDQLESLVSKIVVDERLKKSRRMIMVSCIVEDEDGTAIPLVIRYPDLYPYFRPEIAAPSLNLDYHQHPDSKQLCLLGRDTYNWYSGSSAAELIRDQLPRALKSARATDVTAVTGVEEQQAEPYSDYYRYLAACMLLVDSGWSLPEREKSGFLKVRLSTTPTVDAPWLRGAVSEIQSNGRRVIQRASTELLAAFDGPIVDGRWVRVASPIRTFSWPEFFEQARAADLPKYRDHSQVLNRTQLTIRAVLFPEEIGHRTSGEGWAFACRLLGESRLALDVAARPFSVVPALPEVAALLQRAGSPATH